MRSGTTLDCAGGAAVHFDLPASTLTSLRDRMGYALRAASDRPATVSYRRTRARNGSIGYERVDDRRDRRVEFVGIGIDDLIDDLHLTIALHATDDVYVHAGAVAWNGVAVLLPGRSHAGKSTLVHALVRAGASYLSDEYARITSDGSIASYARPLQLRTPNGRRLVDPHSIGVVGDHAVPAGLVVLTTYVEHADFDPTPVSPGRAALELLDNTVIADSDPIRAAAAVAHVGRTARTVRSERSDAEVAASEILEMADAVVVAA